jgi:deoxyribodipyrimidine photolyase-related protein
MKAFLIFPHQLFEDTTLIFEANHVFIVEHELFFTQYKFHKQKIIFHRASMQFYSDYLSGKNYKVTYINSYENEHKTSALISKLYQLGFRQVQMYHPNDNWLEKQLEKECNKQNLELNFLNSPGFINNKPEDISLLGTKVPFFQTKFYIEQRKKLKLLIDDNKQPFEGKWSFDAENRKRIPKNLELPKLGFPIQNSFIEEAVRYTEKYFLFRSLAFEYSINKK